MYADKQQKNDQCRTLVGEQTCTRPSARPLFTHNSPVTIAQAKFLTGSQTESPAMEQNSLKNIVQRARNETGLPDRLKTGVENLSGYSMDDVRVHYNSSKPAQLQALAYTQGSDIHVAPGQEQHLPHEAWHVVQQKQGRVQPTMQMKGVNVNDNEGLEQEATAMGQSALQCKTKHSPTLKISPAQSTAQRIVKMNGTAVTKEQIEAGLLSALKQDLAVKKNYSPALNTTPYLNKKNIPPTLSDNGKGLANNIFTQYQIIDLDLIDEASLIHQLAQDAILMKDGPIGLVGTPHQFSEYSYLKTSPKDSTVRKQGHSNRTNEMRIYRNMPLEQWTNKTLSGHGASLGEALHYFNNDTKNCVLVEFTIHGATMNQMMKNYNIKGDSEGAKTEGDQFGGKSETASTLPYYQNIFSIDLKHAQSILNNPNVTYSVIASKNSPTPLPPQAAGNWA